jgi:hypothetical protein
MKETRSGLAATSIIARNLKAQREILVSVYLKISGKCEDSQLRSRLDFVSPAFEGKTGGRSARSTTKPQELLMKTPVRSFEICSA